MDIVKPIDMKIRTISEDFYSRSPNTQHIIKSITTTTPTSKFKKEYTLLDKYTESSEEEQKFMLYYGLIQQNQVNGLEKKSKNPTV